MLARQHDATAMRSKVVSTHYAASLLLWVVLLLSLLCDPAIADVREATPTIPEQSGVLMLSEATLARAAQLYSPLLVLFDSPVRKGSLTLFRRFADAASTLRLYHGGASASMRLAAIDVNHVTQPLPLSVQVVGLPTLVTLRCAASIPTGADGINATLASSACSVDSANIEMYDGGRTSSEFQRYLLGQPKRDVVRISKRSELDALLSAKSFVALFVVDGADSIAYFDCSALAQVDVDNSAYAATTDVLLLEQPGVGGTEALQHLPSLVLFRAFGSERVLYDGEWSRAAIARFLQKNRYSLISTYKSADSSYFYDRAAVAHVLLFSDPREPYHALLLAQVEDAARRYYAPANNPGGVVLRFVVVTLAETALKLALVVPDEHFPSVLLLEKITQPPVRMAVFGTEMVWELQGGWFAYSLTNFLETYYPPFAPVEGPNDNGEGEDEASADWRDYSDLFGAAATSVTSLPSRSSWSSSSPQTASPGNSGSVLVEVDADGRTAQQPAEPLTGGERDAFLSIFAPPSPSRSESKEGEDIGRGLAQVVDVADLAALQRVWTLGPALAFFYSPRCLSCRESIGVLDALVAVHAQELAVAQLRAVVRVNIDEMHHLHDRMGLRFEQLPGIALLKPPQLALAFAADADARAAPTVAALLTFVIKSLNPPSAL